jgi:hypothetical protein
VTAEQSGGLVRAAGLARAAGDPELAELIGQLPAGGFVSSADAFAAEKARRWPCVRVTQVQPRVRRPGWYMATGRWSARRRPAAVQLPCLEGLELPVLLPGDVAPERPDAGGMPGVVWLLDGPVFWLPDGTLASPEQRAVACVGGSWAIVPAADRVVARARFYRGGTAVTVATDFLGVDHAADLGGPPVLWETVVWQRRRGGGGCGLGVPSGPRWRYSSRRAALYGHRKVAAAIRAEQRARAARFDSPRRRPVIA